MTGEIGAAASQAGEGGLRVLMVVDGNFPGHTGGAELQAGLLGRELLARGHAVDVVAPWLNRDQPEHESLWGLRVWRIPYPRWKIAGSAWMLVRFAFHLLRHRAKYDAIHVHMVRNMATIAGFLKPMLSASLVMKITGAWEFNGGLLDARLRRRPLHAFMNHCVKRSDYIQCISRYTREVLLEAGYRPQTLAMIPNAVDTTRFQPTAERRSEASRRVKFVGRIEPVKGLDVLLRAWATMRNRRSGDVLVIGGNGVERGRLIELARELGVEGEVQFPGHIEDVSGFLSDAYAYVQPSHQEGLSNSVLQAMAMGLPIVATRVSGNEDLVTPSVNGLLVPAGDSAALSRALDEMLADASLAAAMGAASRSAIAKDYGVDSVMNLLLKAYRKQL